MLTASKAASSVIREVGCAKGGAASTAVKEVVDRPG